MCSLKMSDPTTPSPDSCGDNKKYRQLRPDEIELLRSNYCRAADWNRVLVTDSTDLRLLSHVEIAGSLTIGSLQSSPEHEAGIINARLKDCLLGDDVLIRNIGRAIIGATIGDRARIENVAAIEYEAEAPCGLGITAAVLDETGSRPVKFYPRLSSQIATLMAMMPRWAEDTLFPILDEMAEEAPLPHSIGAGARIVDCGPLLNVHVDREVTIEGARRLANGAILNNADSSRPFAYVGSGVDADGFMIVDGRVDSGALLRHTFVGQGAVIEKGFTSHDSVFFANCSLENGEACALFAGPYTVSMHKASLLIGAMLSFMNAGSGTNQSNHMYKLGPVHWGILERGVKTSSNSYVMWGARVAPFSLVMGSHKNHPDATDFPFSYLFGDDKGATSIVPAMMLRSCGLLRDEKKWPTRDRRLKRKLTMLDRIHFEVLNPKTIDDTLRAIDLMNELEQKPSDDDGVIRYRGMKLRRAHLQRAVAIYTEAVCKYLYGKLGDGTIPEASGEEPARWVDLGGQIIRRSTLQRLLEAETLQEIEQMLDEEFEAFPELEMQWIADRLPSTWRERQGEIAVGAAAFDRHVEEDRTSYREGLAAEHTMLAL